MVGREIGGIKVAREFKLNFANNVWKGRWYNEFEVRFVRGNGKNVQNAREICRSNMKP